MAVGTLACQSVVPNSTYQPWATADSIGRFRPGRGLVGVGTRDLVRNVGGRADACGHGEDERVAHVVRVHGLDGPRRGQAGTSARVWPAAASDLDEASTRPPTTTAAVTATSAAAATFNGLPINGIDRPILSMTRVYRGAATGYAPSAVPGRRRPFAAAAPPLDLEQAESGHEQKSGAVADPASGDLVGIGEDDGRIVRLGGQPQHGQPGQAGEGAEPGHGHARTRVGPGW